MYVLTEDEIAVLSRIEARLEAYLEECGDTDAPGVVLIEEELELVRLIIKDREAGVNGE